MKKGILLGIAMVVNYLYAQNLHLSIRAGVFNYSGELQSKSFTLNQARPGVGIGLKHDLSEHLSARMHIHYAGIQADDKQGTTDMQARNLNFKTSLIDAELGMQYNIVSLNEKWWTPYLFVGIGLLHYNPYTTYNKQKVYLPPLSTEGQGVVAGSKAYQLTQFQLPLAVGAEHALNADMRLGLELGYRKLFTDYLDDVSTSYADANALLAARGTTAVNLAYRGYEVGAGSYPSAKTVRGNSSNKDAYYYVAITYTLRFELDTYRRIAGLPAYKKDKKVGCPGISY
jgi:hypothetical protein